MFTAGTYRQICKTSTHDKNIDWLLVRYEVKYSVDLSLAWVQGVPFPNPHSIQYCDFLVWHLPTFE